MNGWLFVYLAIVFVLFVSLELVQLVLELIQWGIVVVAPLQ